MDIVNEQTTYRIVAEFFGEDGAPMTPISGEYRIDDILSDSVIKDWTPFTPVGPQHVITVAYGENAIVNTANDYEERVITVRAPYGQEKQATGEYRYKVRNLLKIT